MAAASIAGVKALGIFFMCGNPLLVHARSGSDVFEECAHEHGYQDHSEGCANDEAQLELDCGDAAYRIGSMLRYM
jgi:hypothetical protein